ncbi:MAG: alpha/beta hydrolase, partial [Cyanobacteria bacterium J06648_11]
MKTVLSAIAIASSALAVSLPATAAQMRDVAFDSEGDRLVGTLYLPDDYEPGDELPAAIVTGAWTTVKEQMPATYAEQLADRGYAALTFDFRNWGESGGDRRQLENPSLKTEDIQNAARFLATLPEVDDTRIGGVGICASAGYMAAAVADTLE